MKTRYSRGGSVFAGFLLLTGCSFLWAQSGSHGWRRADEPAPNQSEASVADRSFPGDQNAAPPEQRNPEVRNQYPPPASVPSQLTIKPGTFLTVRVNQPLSSDHNQTGDAFSASLVRPLVVDGVVVAHAGEILAGRVVEAKKAGRVEGVSRLAVQLTDLTLVDGQQLPIQTQLLNRTGPTSEGRDAAAIGSTTALGAAAGAAADWGRGAAIGAGAGAAAGIIGVLLTRGQPTIIYPESVLTFRVEAPVTISTERAPQAFRYVEPEDYDHSRTYEVGTRQGPSPARCAYGCPPPAPAYYYGPPVYPYYYGPSFAYFYGPRFYHGGGFFIGRGRRYWR